MTAITVQLDEAEARLIRKYANLEGKGTSDFIRDVVLDCIEDREDLATLRKAVMEDDGVRYSHNQVLEELSRSYLQ